MGTKRHINGKGEPGKCSVDLNNPNSKGCPFGGKSGKDEHFDTRQEAIDFYESKQSKNGLLLKTFRSDSPDYLQISELGVKRYTDHLNSWREKQEEKFADSNIRFRGIDKASGDKFALESDQLTTIPLQIREWQKFWEQSKDGEFPELLKTGETADKLRELSEKFVPSE